MPRGRYLGVAQSPRRQPTGQGDSATRRREVKGKSWPNCRWKQAWGVGRYSPGSVRSVISRSTSREPGCMRYVRQRRQILALGKQDEPRAEHQTTRLEALRQDDAPWQGGGVLASRNCTQRAGLEQARGGGRRANDSQNPSCRFVWGCTERRATGGLARAHVQEPRPRFCQLRQRRALRLRRLPLPLARFFACARGEVR